MPDREPLTGVIPRERLFASLDRAVCEPADPAPAVLLRAPTGAGKTTLLATWSAHRAERLGDVPRIAWVSLEPRHGHPAALREAIRAALASAGPPPAASRVPHPRRGAPPVCLVVDNAHELVGRPAAHLLATVVREAPLRLVLAGRTAPPLRSWLRARGRLREVRGRDLAFTAAEVERLLRAHDVVLSDDDLVELLHRTRGLAARVRLAVTSSTGRGTPAPAGRGRASEPCAPEARAAEPLERAEVVGTRSVGWPGPGG